MRARVKRPRAFKTKLYSSEHVFAKVLTHTTMTIGEQKIELADKLLFNK